MCVLCQLPGPRHLAMWPAEHGSSVRKAGWGDQGTALSWELGLEEEVPITTAVGAAAAMRCCTLLLCPEQSQRLLTASSPDPHPARCPRVHVCSTATLPPFHYAVSGHSPPGWAT